GDQLHLAVRQVPNISAHWKLLRQAKDCVAKTDSLDPTPIVDAFAYRHGGILTPAGRSRFTTIARRRTPAQLVAQRLEKAPLRHLDKAERDRSAAYRHSVAILENKRLLPIDNDHGMFRSASQMNGINPVRGIDNGAIGQRVRTYGS